MKKSLTKVERLRTKKEFARVFDKPDAESGCRGARIIVKRNELGHNRFVVIPVRKYGNSIERNYSRRILREIYRKNKQLFPAGNDIIIVLYPGRYRYHERYQQFLELAQGISFAKKSR